MKIISALSVDETIALLKQSPEQLQKTSYTRGGLIIHLVSTSYKTSFTLHDQADHKKAKDFLAFLLQEGSEEDKRTVALVYVD